MPEKQRKPYPTLKLVVNPKEVTQAQDPATLKGGLDFRLFEDRGDETVELDTKDVRIDDWNVRPSDKKKADGKSIGQARIHIPKYETKTGPRPADFAVDVISGGLTTKEEYSMREKLLADIGDPTLTFLGTLGETINGIREMTSVPHVSIALASETPLTVDGGSIKYFSLSDGKLTRKTVNVGGDSQFVKSMLGPAESLNAEPSEADAKIVGEGIRRMSVFPLNALATGGRDNIIGSVQLMRGSKKKITESDIEAIRSVSGSVAMEIVKKRLQTYDPISGAMDRRNFGVRARGHIISNMESPDSVVFGVSDLDHFKDHVVSPFGHQAASSVIRQYVALAKKTLGDDGIIGAYGGDEFTFMSWDGAEPGINRLDSVRKAVENHSFTVTLPAEKKDQIVIGNEIGLLKVKDGKNRIVVTDDTQISETDGRILIGLPPGTITATIGASTMGEAMTQKADQSAVYNEMLRRSLDRVNDVKAGTERNKLVY